ncbi:MAG: PaaI family thioesterase [Chloroflexi bacterium]|nr:PaaI family thioesterase [Chloroflexota bacterium]
MTAPEPAPKRHDQQPSSKWCFVCGVENVCGLQLRFFDDGPGGVITRVTLGDTYQSYPGMAHGGILATIMDETLGRAVLSGGDPNEPRFMFTARMEIRYRRPVPLHEEFTARGRVEKDRGRLVTARGEIVLADGTVAVEAEATLAEIPAGQIEQMKMQDVGWQVYP